MALDWIKMRTELSDDPRVLRISEIVGLKDPDFTVGKLHRIWSYFDQHSVDGTVRYASARTLDALVKTEGFAEAMAAVGWLVIGDESVTLPHFDEHNGGSAKRRAQDARRKASERSGKALPSGEQPPVAEKQARSGTMVNASGSGVVRHRTDRVRTGDGPIAESEWTESGQRDDLDESERRREESAFKRSDADQLARRDRGLVPFPLTQFEFDSLFERILEVTGEEDDWKIRSLYRRYAETLGPPLVERALSATKDRKLDASQPKVRRLGAYFNKTCRSIAVECNIELGRDGGTRAAPADPRASASEEGCGKPVAETLSAQDTGCASAPT